MSPVTYGLLNLFSIVLILASVIIAIAGFIWGFSLSKDRTTFLLRNLPALPSAEKRKNYENQSSNVGINGNSRFNYPRRVFRTD